MKKYGQAIATITLTAAVVITAVAGKLKNSSFEEDFGLREDSNMWGDYGVTFGECYQVTAGKDGHPAKAHSGDRILVINTPSNSWNGIWQQIPWDENTPYAWHAYYLIQGGDLGPSCATFMKTEFFDASDNKLGESVGEPHRADTRGEWIRDTMRGKTPPGTASVRFVLIAGNNPDGPTLYNRIYWDDADTISVITQK